MPRERLSRAIRSAKVRADADILVEGSGPSYGWVSNQGHDFGPMTWGDYDPDNTPQWWLGSDVFDGNPIGPNGPGDPSGGGYGWDPRARLPHGSWWNRPRSTSGMIAAVTRCTQVIVSPIVRTPWKVERKDGTSLDVPTWITDPMLTGRVPGDTVPLTGAGTRLTGYNFWATYLTHMLWWGRAAFVSILGSTGEPIPGSLKLLNPYMIGLHGDRWVIDPHGDHPVVTDFDGSFTMGGQTWRLTVGHGMAPNDGHTPEGVLVRHFDTLRLGAAVTKFVASTFGSGVPSGYLKVSQPNFDEHKAADLKRSWMQSHGSGKRSVAVLNSTVEYQPISISPVDAEASKVWAATRTEIAHAFGLSASWLDTGDASNTYANLTDKRKDLLATTLTGWGAQLSERLSSLMPYGTNVNINWQAYTAPDLVETIPAMVQAVQAGLMSVDEARQHMGLTPGQEFVADKPSTVVTDQHGLDE